MQIAIVLLPLHPASEGMGRWLRDQQIEKQKREKNNKKIKFILFGSWEKISTFALPTERKGKKDQVADVITIIKTRLKQTKNKLRRIRLKRTEV